MTSTRSDHLRLELVDDTPNWQKPSTCKRPALFLMENGRRRRVDPREDAWRDSPPDTRTFPLDAEIVNEDPIDPMRIFPSPPPVPVAGFWHRLLVLICGH